MTAPEREAICDTVDVVLRHTVFASANYVYLPFEVPPGVSRLDVALRSNARTQLGLGLFDVRGAGYQSPGFRGITGTERREVFLALDDATPGFLAGPIPAGTWTVVLPVFLAVLPTQVTITVRMSRAPGGPVARHGPQQGVVRNAAGWYRGDLHCHTVASSDAWRTGSALDVADWADLARDLGLDFLAMTDHNVISQNHDLARDAGDDVLVLAGEEVTNYFHGHATVAGITSDAWFDFRQVPRGLRLSTGSGRMTDLVRAVHEAGGFMSAAHPTHPWMPWQFLLDGLRDPGARPHGLEVWNGRWDRANETALAVWHRLLCRGWDVVANGGSDLHALPDRKDGAPGSPTTVVHAASLARDTVVAGLRSGRSFITRHPDGVEIYLTASGPDGQHTYTGGSIWTGSASMVRVRAHVRRAAGMSLLLHTRHGLLEHRPVLSDGETVELTLVTGPHRDFVRAEVRRHPPSHLPGLVRLDLEALTNPIRLLPGSPPPGVPAEHAPPPPP